MGFPATTLRFAANAAQANVQENFQDGAKDLRTIQQTWLTGLLGILSEGQELERTVRNWIDYGEVIALSIDPVIANQTQLDANNVGFHLHRVCVAAFVADRDGFITTAQGTAILDLYNANWIV
jgi:hypothetical protein